MCTDLNHGGHRCATETRDPYRNLMERVGDAGDWKTGARLMDAQMQDVIDYARTKSGRDEILSDITGHEDLFRGTGASTREELEGQVTVLAIYEYAIAEADRLNEKGKGVKNGLRESCAEFSQSPTPTATASGSRPSAQQVSAIEERLTATPEPEDYRLSHRAPGPDDGARFDNVEEMMPDYYTRPNLYRHSPTVDRECHAAIMKAKGNPDATITIYRALPVEHSTVNDGDWVTVSRAYAEEHAASEGDQFHIIAVDVPAHALWTEGYAAEWGYNGPPLAT